MFDIFSYVLSGIAIAVALFILLFAPNRSLRMKVAGVSIGCAATGLFAPAVGFYLWIVVIVGLVIAAIVSIVRGFKNLRF
jgi:hypothetical protein